jgi:hypothetical protein
LTEAIRATGQMVMFPGSQCHPGGMFDKPGIYLVLANPEQTPPPMFQYLARALSVAKIPFAVGNSRGRIGYPEFCVFVSD